MIYPAPSYLTGLVVEANQEKLSEIQENYGDNTTAFKFTTRFNNLIQTWLDDFGHYGGTVWGIDTSGNKILLFDQYRHGYNGVMRVNGEEDLESTKTFSLPESTEIIIAFQYMGDEDEYVEDGTSKFKQDYFGWVVIYKLKNGELEEFISYECA